MLTSSLRFFVVVLSVIFVIIKFYFTITFYHVHVYFPLMPNGWCNVRTLNFEVWTFMGGGIDYGLLLRDRPTCSGPALSLPALELVNPYLSLSSLSGLGELSWQNKARISISEDAMTC